MKKDGTVGHMFECVAVDYPDPNQCKTAWINKPKEIK